MYSFIINPTKIKNIELNADSNLGNAKYSTADHNSCYGFKSYVQLIEFTDGTILNKPDIDIESFYLFDNAGFRPHYFKILESHLERGKHIPFYIENSIAPSLFGLEKNLKNIDYIGQNRLIMKFKDKHQYASAKIKYGL